MVTMLSTSFGPYNVGHMSNLGHVDIVDDHLHEDKTSNQYAVVESDRTYPLAYIFGNFISLHHSSINPNHFLKLATFDDEKVFFWQRYFSFFNLDFFNETFNAAFLLILMIFYSKHLKNIENCNRTMNSCLQTAQNVYSVYIKGD